MSNGNVLMFICGSALRGQPNHNNIAHCRLVKASKTAPLYRLHSVEDKHPGIYEVEEGGIAITGELYEMTPDQYDYLLAHEPPNLYPSSIELEDGTTAIAMLYPQSLIKKNGYPDISHHNGSWATYKASQS
ncbi:gamma-glutamylcyclotransferase [Spirulina sp. CS-785/01]|uniref:allophanate hydrolase-related protein n=1 Tax=Spirulina sp. CS-785/01 TaxID=3021716 RepID=UPI00232C1964|nr:gamma-glutamylcyclotransferase [Spirulina sp. CS-785/01]MDB9311902.1 gamma-glutamylcyclotransferase [Spirulina sp. CS-785/01]